MQQPAEPTPPSAQPLLAAQERTYADALLRRILRECPRRRATSADEARAGQILVEELAQRGLEVQIEEFRFNDDLYANLALHFGLGSLATLLCTFSPLAAMALHLLAGISYLADSTRRGYLLRRVFPFKRSQNVVAVMPSREAPELRIVLVAHLDAAPTGWTFRPRLLRAFNRAQGKSWAFLQRSVATATFGLFALAALDLFAHVRAGPSWPLLSLMWIVTLPAVLLFLSGTEIALRRRIVPGANDNLSGVVALPLLADRLAQARHPRIEIVLVATGCEEASLGGADALARAKEGIWSKAKTVIVALDGLSNGELRLLTSEGEVVRRYAPRWLSTMAHRVAASDPRFRQVQDFAVPVGATDAAAFLAHDYDALALACIDPDLGAPRHYHLPTDDADHLDMDQLILSIDYAEALVQRIIRFRLGDQHG